MFGTSAPTHEACSDRGHAQISRSTAAGAFAEARDKFVGVLKRAAATMNRLIGDLLDAAALETGRLTIEPEELDVAGLVQEIAEQFRPKAADRDVRLDVELAECDAESVCLPVADSGPGLAIAERIAEAPGVARESPSREKRKR